MKKNNIKDRVSFFLVNQIPIVVATFAVSLFSLFLLSDSFLSQFLQGRAIQTAGFICTNYILFLSLLFALVVFVKDNLKSSEFVLVCIVVSLTYIACVTALKYLSVYAVPIALCALLIGVLLSPRIAVYSVGALSIMLMFACFFQNGGLSSATLNCFSAVIANSIASFTIIYFISLHYTRIKFLLYVVIASVVALPFILMSSLASGVYDIALLLSCAMSVASNFIAILLFLPLLPIFESAFNIANDFRLDELINLNHPLLKRLATDAPGTFNHSLVVGNLAESCAVAIGENPLLAKAGAYYHDVGKLKSPMYFVENQSDYNPHDELIPEVSASMITSHTLFGEILNKQYRLPDEIVKISKEHHGTSPVGYFYNKALKLIEGSLPMDNYVYPGPKPSTKISAIIMIADTAEAAFRAHMPETKEEFVEKINKLVDEKIALGQFDECPITMRELATIKDTIINVLPSVHHNRINYDKNLKKQP